MCSSRGWGTEMATASSVKYTWPQLAEQIVARLIAALPPDQLDPARTHAARLSALPIGGSMWADYYLRPNGEVVIVGEDDEHPNVDSVYMDCVRVLMVLVWGSRRYPELRQLLPPREPDSTDCVCLRYPNFFGPGKTVCSICGGLGWLPPVSPGRGESQ